MKLKYLAFVIISFVATLLSACTCFEASWEAKEREYYADAENYIVLTATVTDKPTYFEKKDYYLLNIEFEDKEVVQYESRVEIHKSNGDILEKNGYFEEISEGDKIQITLAPEIFGDGYIIPAVGIKTQEKVYLAFEIGMANLMSTYN